ncbi:toxic anion resistance protein [Bacillus sp. HMF5848]|uniref:toxic anion resistance protein n=1 Tax=Bacillus sp. HMF5848 TaxID=2495421 RepID=UPI000F7AC0D7|nr:toxic anion resistance protein [Bacillus sp. HMF5848]RSK26056.1 toxic anion resistance protein [Bacillus sp. HMF5848]
MEQYKVTEWEAQPMKEVEAEKVREIAKQIDIADSAFVMGYGSTTQKDISSFADKVLGHVKAKDSGEVGQTLTSLMHRVKEVNVDSLSKPKKKIPIIGNMFNNAKKFMTQFESVSVQIEKIADQLDRAKVGLIKDITLLENLYDKNKDFYKQLTLYIEAGEVKLHELRTEVLPALQQKVDETNDPQLVQELSDMKQSVERFDKKLHDLKLSRNITIQTAPQIRLIQNNNQVLAEKIQSSILNTIPIWKNQIVMALTLHRQRTALDLQKDVTKTTNELLLKNSEMLKQGTIEIAQEAEKGIVDITTLRKTHDNLLSTLEETIKIQHEGRIKRHEAEQELVKMEGEMKERIRSIISQR